MCVCVVCVCVCVCACVCVCVWGGGRAGGTGQAGPAMAGPLSQLDGPCDSCKTGVKKSRGT